MSVERSGDGGQRAEAACACSSSRCAAHPHSWGWSWFMWCAPSSSAGLGRVLCDLGSARGVEVYAGSSAKRFTVGGSSLI